VPTLLAEVTRGREAATAAKATRIVVVLAAETSTQEATVMWDSTALHVKDAEDWATLVEREALERVSRVEAENAVVLGSVYEDVEGFVQKIALLQSELVAKRQT
jgi:hypothetical protein